MSVLSIRAHKRFAVCHKVKLSASDEYPIMGMLIEVSKGGCRISNLGSAEYELGSPLAVKFDDFQDISGEVRSCREGVVGIRFRKPLHGTCLDRLIRVCRGEGNRMNGIRQALG